MIPGRYRRHRLLRQHYFIAFLLKVVLVVFLYIWLRGTFPRLRYDMLMRLGWKFLLPLAIANVVVTAIILVAVT